MIRYRHIFSLLLLFVGSVALRAASVEYGFFDHFTTKDGLVSNRVFSIDQDADGFVWIATDFGLERFDGQSFKHHRKDDYANMTREDFLFVHALPCGRVAAGGYSGLYVEYDPLADSVWAGSIQGGTSFFQETMNVYFRGDKQYLYTGAGVYTYDEQNHCYANQNALYEGTRNRFTRAMFVDEYDRYWLGSMDSMMVFDADGKQIYGYVPQGDACSFVRTMVPLNDSLLIVAGQTSEVWIFNVKEKSIQEPIVVKTPFDCITNIVRDEANRFWIATDAFGLWYTDDLLSLEPAFTNLVPFNASVEEVRKIYCLMKDSKGDIWFGTQSSGVWHYRKHNATGITCSWNFGFPSVVCSSFQDDGRGGLLVGVDGGGLFSLDDKFHVKPIAKFPNNNISGVVTQKSDVCYVASWGGGVYRCDPNTGVFERERFDGVASPSNCFFGIKSVNGSDLVACSSGDGYYRLRSGSSSWEKVQFPDSLSDLDNGWILSVCAGDKGDLWVLSSNMLWRETNGNYVLYERNTDTTDNLLGLIDMISDGEGGIFVATNRGLAHYRPDSPKPELLDFVPHAYFRDITKDDDGRYWVAGDEGILSFDYAKRECSRLPENYIDVKSFLFQPRSSFKAKDGKLYFGTNEGFISVDPLRLSFDTVIPYLSLSQLYLGGKKVSASSELMAGVPLSRMTELRLAYGQTDIAFDVDVIDYSDADRVQCQYRLVGLQEEWQPLQADRKVNFSYIPTGEYTLEVRAFRTNVACEEKIVSLPLIVLPPWWNTWWFYALAGLLALVLVYLVFKWRMKRLIAQKNMLNEQVSLRTLELQNALKDKDSLISVIGHDLRNPMFAIVVALENWLNKEREMSPEGRHSLISDVRDSAKTLQGEMLKLLDWAQSKNEDLVCKPQDFDLLPVVEDAVQLTAAQLKRKEIVCEKRISLEHKAFADSRMISAVVRNLLGNAVKFTGQGGTITVGASEENGSIVLFVQDSGVGMAEETVRSLLSEGRVESTEGTDHERGTGLGLVMCKKYVQLNGGTFDVASKVGEGTRFTITLPASEAKVVFEEDVKRTLSDKSEETRECLADNVILMVDDNPLICENMKTLLSDFCEVLVAHDGQAALDVVRDNDVDLILSDVDMPVMNGIEMCVKLQGDELFSHIPILFLSARTDESDRLLGLTQGAIDYIPKPFSQEELMAKLRSIFKLRKQERAYLLAQLMKPKGEESAETEPQEVKEDPFVAKFMELVRERYTDTELSVDDLADVLCVSRSTMFRRVKLLVGKSPLELLSDYRLNEAMRLLKTQNFSSVSDVAYSVGFSDPSYFSKRFKAYFGVSPTQIKA